MMSKKDLFLFSVITILVSTSFLPIATAHQKVVLNTERMKRVNKEHKMNILGGKTIKLKITEIKAYDNPDPWPWAEKADFKIYVTIDGKTNETSFDSDRNHIYTAWTASQTLESSKEQVDIRIKLVDRDPGGSEQTCDINPDRGSKSCEIIYNTETGKWAGDDGGTGNSRGNEYPECEIWFTVWHEKEEELTAEANGPYYTRVGEKLQLHGSASGGEKPYSWYWRFNKNGEDIKTSSERNPTVTFYTTGKIYAVLRVKDSKRNRDVDVAEIAVYDSKDDNYAVFIAGGDGVSYPGWFPVNLAEDEDFEEEAQYGYETFKELGYQDSNIYYLSGKHRKNGGDAVTNKKNVKYAIKDWLKSRAKSKSDIFIFLSGHGLFTGTDSIVAVHPGKPWNMWEMVSSSEVDRWLDGLTYSACTVVVEACYSGDFINDLSGKNRIVMTATDREHSAFSGAFPDPFFTKLSETNEHHRPSYGEAWMAADEYCDGSSPDEQNPLIDDNGDGEGFGSSRVDKLPNDKDGDGEEDPGEDGWFAMQVRP